MSSQTSTKEILPLLLDHLPEFAIRKLKEELNEFPERKTAALQELRFLLEDNDRTRGINFHEDFLIQYLRRNKYRIRDAFQQLQNFVNLNRKESYLFLSIREQYLESIASKFIVLLPKRTPDGCAVLIFQLGKWDPKELPFHYFKQLILMLFYQLLRDPMNQINGFKFIDDFQGTLHLVKYFTPHNLYLLYNAAVNCLPGRWKGTHMINEPIVMKAVWTVIKPFLTQKIRNRIFIHSNKEELFDYFPRSIIPTSLGGTSKEPDMEDWIRRANREHEKYSIEGQPNFYSC